MNYSAQLNAVISKVFSNSIAPGLALSQKVTYRKVIPGSFDITTGSFTDSVVEQEVDAVRVDEAQSGVTDTQGPALTESAKFYIKPLSGVILSAVKDDKIIISGAEYTITEVAQESLGGTHIILIIKASALTPSA